MVKRVLFLIFAFLLFLFFRFSSAAEDLMRNSAIDYFNEGTNFQKAANFIEAESCYQKALLVGAYDRDLQRLVFNNMGVIYAKRGDFDTAEEFFNQALQIDPNYKLPQLNLGIIYESRRSRLESLEYWAKVFDFEKLKPKDFVIEGKQEVIK
jgi:tetratricopeptide (TPR) repeat protein